ncbi:MAG: response regulator [Snowella sp.]|nr:response regulator [Snowella sp.]
MSAFPLGPALNLSDELVQETPYKFLQKLAHYQVSGKLTIQNPFDEYVHWQVYLGNGKIHAANSKVGSSERLDYLLGHCLVEKQIQLPTHLMDDYEYICKLWKNEVFSFQQTRSILTQCTQEALVQILSLPTSNCYLESKGRLEQLFLNLDFEQLLSQIKPKIRYWWQLRSEINSPFQRPLVEDWQKLQLALAKATWNNKHQLQQLNRALKDLNSLYKIGNATKISTLQLALLLHPLIKAGDISMLSYQEIQEDHRPSIAYIGDRPANQRMAKFTLENSDLKITIIDTPFKALAVLLSQKFDLVLIDTNMVDMDGYQLCSLCRQSDSLKNLPIILLTDENNLTCRIKAKLSGASSYLGKPFLPQELVKVINTHLTNSQNVTRSPKLRD